MLFNYIDEINHSHVGEITEDSITLNGNKLSIETITEFSGYRYYCQNPDYSVCILRLSDGSKISIACEPATPSGGGRSTAIPIASNIYQRLEWHNSQADTRAIPLTWSDDSSPRF